MLDVGCRVSGVRAFVYRINAFLLKSFLILSQAKLQIIIYYQRADLHKYFYFQIICL